MKTYATLELVPRLVDSRKSFYGKATVHRKNTLIDGLLTETVSLYSYGTNVATVTHTAERSAVVLLPKWDCSATTLRHVKEFLAQECGIKGTKAELARLIGR